MVLGYQVVAMKKMVYSMKGLLVTTFFVVRDFMPKIIVDLL